MLINPCSACNAKGILSGRPTQSGLTFQWAMLHDRCCLRPSPLLRRLQQPAQTPSMAPSPTRICMHMQHLPTNKQIRCLPVRASAGGPGSLTCLQPIINTASCSSAHLPQNISHLCGLQQEAQAALHALSHQLKAVGAPAAAVLRKQPPKQLLLRGGGGQQQQQQLCSLKKKRFRAGCRIHACNLTTAMHERGQPVVLHRITPQQQKVCQHPPARQ